MHESTNPEPLAPIVRRVLQIAVAARRGRRRAESLKDRERMTRGNRRDVVKISRAAPAWRAAA